MPTIGWGDGYRNISRRLRAWKAHYMAKGCTDTKADKVAYEKVRRCRTWPPGHRR